MKVGKSYLKAENFLKIMNKTKRREFLGVYNFTGISSKRFNDSGVTSQL